MDEEMDEILSRTDLDIEHASKTTAFSTAVAKRTKGAELRNKMKREELIREIATQAFKGKLDKEWREKVLKALMPMCKQNIEVMRATYDRTFDKMNHMIKDLKKQIREVREVSTTMSASFCAATDAMTSKFLVDLEAICRENEQRNFQIIQMFD